MATYDLAISVRAEGLPPGREGNDAFGELLDCVMERFFEIGLPEVDYVASLAKREAEFILSAEGPDFESAVIVAMGNLRTALHAAECATPEWPDLHALTESIRRIDPDRDGDPSGERELAGA